jgi:hypothetical protein
MTLLAITHHNGIRLAELGFLLDAIGAGLFALTALAPGGKRMGSFVGGALLAVGSALLVVATHWGHFN